MDAYQQRGRTGKIRTLSLVHIPPNYVGAHSLIKCLSPKWLESGHCLEYAAATDTCLMTLLEPGVVFRAMITAS